ERALAEELYQEIWMRVIEARGRYRPAARFGTWLYTIAHHRLVDHWRARGLSLAALEEAEARPDTSLEPAARAEAREQLERLSRALAELPPAQREAFLLHEEA